MNKIKLTTDSIPAITVEDCELKITLDNVTNLDLCQIDQDILIKTFCGYGKQKELFKELIESNEELMENYFTDNMGELHELCNNLGCGLIK